MSETGGNGPAPVEADADKGRCTGVVRYGYMNHIGEFTHPESLTLHCQDAVVVQTERGIELGEYVSFTCPTGGLTCIEHQQMETYVANSGPEYLRPRAGRILRVATDEDREEHRHILNGTEEKLHLCQQLTTQHNLPMKLVACEHVFGGERIIFYFLSEGRVDFRELVKDLAHEYQTRIEMRQVGARDEARLVADYEICGRECCCKNFLKTLRPVNMKMAKLQKATLDPSKVSGRCGRLRCCLRYEHESYQELSARLPRTGLWVVTEHGTGKVVDRQVLTQLVQFESPEGRRLSVGVEEINEVLSAPPPPEQAAAPAGEPARTPTRRRPRGVRGPKAVEPEGPPEVEREEPMQSPGEPAGEESSTGPAESLARAEAAAKRRRRRRGRRRRPAPGTDSSGGVPTGDQDG